MVTPVSPPPRAFITCHALDTTTGRPAAGIKVELVLDEPSIASNQSLSAPMHATTNNDGRIAVWVGSSPTTALSPDELVSQAAPHLSGERLRWKLLFHTEEYYGPGKTFFPHVEIPFYTDFAKSHFHVPLLLGPWSYTTYRGS
ncbi:hypothetical protein ANO11243_005140 [Dothideomycetidae sp. 11243]|nr:hypothetical protein ANO11243_005140 [fungal sp. No.11243]